MEDKSFLNKPSTGSTPAHNSTTSKQGGTTNEYYHLTSAELTQVVAKGWKIIPAANYTATPASTSTITMGVDMTASVIVGLPLRYTISSVEYFGIVTAITSNLLTIAGAPLGGDVSNLKYGDISNVQNAVIMIPSTYEDASNTALIASDLKTSLVWNKSKSYIVGYKVYSDTADSSGDGKVSVRVGDTELNTSADGLTIAAAKTWYSTVVDIATAVYEIVYGDVIEVTCVAGTGKDASDLTVKLIIVNP